MKKLLALSFASAFLVTACASGVANEKQAFIDATAETTCMIFQSENIFDPALEEKAKEIYASYGFDSEDEEAMIALTQKYEEDEEVQAAILDAIAECGGDDFGDLDIDLGEGAEGEAAEGEGSEG